MWFNSSSAFNVLILMTWILSERQLLWSSPVHFWRSHSGYLTSKNPTLLLLKVSFFMIKSDVMEVFKMKKDAGRTSCGQEHKQRSSIQNHNKEFHEGIQMKLLYPKRKWMWNLPGQEIVEANSINIFTETEQTFQGDGNRGWHW